MYDELIISIFRSKNKSPALCLLNKKVKDRAN